MPSGGIDYLIYSRQEKAILWADIIQVGVINANSSPSIFFREYNHVHQPVWIFEFFNESSWQ